MKVMRFVGFILLLIGAAILAVSGFQASMDLAEGRQVQGDDILRIKLVVGGFCCFLGILILAKTWKTRPTGPTKDSQVSQTLPYSTVREIAQYHRMLLTFVSVGILMGVALAIAQTVVNSSFALLSIAGFLSFALYILLTAYVFKLSEKLYGPTPGIFMAWLLFTPIPIGGLVILLILDNKARKVLKGNGVPVGFFGATDDVPLDSDARDWISAQINARPPIADEQVMIDYFMEGEVDPKVVAKLRRLFGKIVQAPSANILPDDDLAAFWPEDNRRDLFAEIENSFRITISEDDAEEMACRVRSIAKLVASKRNLNVS